MGFDETKCGSYTEDRLRLDLPDSSVLNDNEQNDGGNSSDSSLNREIDDRAEFAENAEIESERQIFKADVRFPPPNHGAADTPIDTASKKGQCTSEKKIEANRLNAKRSTGPKTQQGKSRSKQNATKRGLHARSHLLRGEDATDYKRLAEDVYKQRKPKGPMEERVANHIVGIYWRLDRIDRAEFAVLSDLTAWSAGKFYSDVGSPGSIEGVSLCDIRAEELLIKTGKDMGRTAGMLDNAHKASVSDYYHMQTMSHIDRLRQSALRALKRWEEHLKSLQELRTTREESEWQEGMRQLPEGRRRRPIAVPGG